MKASDIRRGSVVLHNNIPHRVMEFRHHTPGNLRAMVQAKLRNLITGNQTEIKWSSTEELPEADVMTSRATYLYRDGDGYHFMVEETYDQVALNDETMGDSIYYVEEQMQVDLTLFEGAPIGISLPSTVVLTVVETSPEIRGATASNSPKPAKTNTGLTISVPPFIKEGEQVVVSTGDGSYVERANK